MKYLKIKIIVFTLFIFTNSGLYARDNNFSVGVNYALSAQTNDYGPIKSFGNAVDVYGEFYLLSFLSFYAGYQFMDYNWENQPTNTELFDNRMLLGARFYFAGAFVGGGAYSTWTKISGSTTKKDNYWGGYLDFGYDFFISQNLSLETGARFYFLGDNEKKLLLPSLTGTVSKDGTVDYHWDWFIGIKYLL